MVGSITITTATSSSLPSEYYAMVVDSGPIIKQDVRNLMGKAQTYVTTPSVLREIRDSKARNYMEHSVLPLLDLQVREPTEKSIQEIAMANENVKKSLANTSIKKVIYIKEKLINFVI